MRLLVLITIIVFLALAASPCRAEIPRTVNYQGMLTSDAGDPLNGSYDLNFKIYGSESGNDSLWWEYHSGVTITDGLFNVILGSTNPIPASVFDDTLRYFGITVGSDTELSPRTRLTSMPYAYRALVADSAAVAGTGVGSGGGWVDEGTVVRLEDTTDNVGIGTMTPDDDLHVANHIRVGDDPDYPTVYGELKHDGGGTGFKINAHAGGGGWADLHFQTNATTKMFIESSGKVGIGTTTPGVKLHIEGGGDVKVNTPNTGYLIIGSSTGSHIAIDNNEIMAKARGDSVGDLYIQYSDEARTIIYGNVGIGMTSPSHKLHVTQDNSVYSAVYAERQSNGNFGAIGNTLSGVFGSSSSGMGVWGSSSSGTGVYYSGGLAGTGSKSCVVKTSKGPTLLYCQESPENWFEDFGEAKLSAGRCHIELDPLFLETVTINEPNPMKVFIQLNDDCNGTYVERGRTGFDVIELQGGQSNAGFTYRVVAKRSGFEDKRLNVCQAAKTDPYLYPEMKEMMDRE